MAKKAVLTASAVLLTLSLVLTTGCPSRRPDGVSPDLRRQFEVTVFTDDEDTGRRVLAAIEALGYTNPGNEVLGNPNDEFNIKWGAADRDVLDEIRAVVEPMMHQELFPRHLFGPDDMDIFINLPVCKLGGAYRPPTCGGAPGPGPGPGTVDPQYDAQGIPQACGMSQDSVDFGSISVGTEIILGRHRAVDGNDNWVEDMEEYVGRSGRVTELFGVDGSGCPVVHVDIDGGDWFWRVRDMQLGSGGGTSASGACGMTDETVSYGAIQVGTKVRLERHSAWQGDANWAEPMGAFVGREATVTSLEGVDGAGCAVVHVDVDGGDWFWRARDLTDLSGGGLGPASSSDFPQQCGLSDEASVYGAAYVGATVRLGQHRPVDGNANWNESMAEWVGSVGKVTEHLGSDSAGCPVVHVDVDGGRWAWRVRDLSKP